MNVLFLGLMYSDKTLVEARSYSKAPLQMAAHTFQMNLISGLESIEGVSVKVVNLPAVGSFPINCKKVIFKKQAWGKNNIQIGFPNLPIIKRAVQSAKIWAEIKKYAKSTGGEFSIVAYSPFIPFLKVMNKAKRKFPALKSCLIVTDCIPGREDMERYMTPAAKRRGDRIVELARSVDGFALLTENLASALEIEGKPYAITECVCNPSQPVCRENAESKNRCLYTGTLNYEFGIKDITDAFAKVENAELWICGDGSAKAYVEQMASNHKNIKYFGFLARNELQEIRNECDFLINPRRPSGTYTKYSFPSKTAEYMLTGKPVIMYKLEGIPDEYDEYLNYLTEDNSEGICRELNAIFSEDYNCLKEKAYGARRFMLENKTAEKQAEKILRLLS